MTDKKIGYISLLFLLVFMLLSLSVILYRVFSPYEQRIICFDTIGNLNIEDPVRVRGIRVGFISGIESREHRAFVRVTFDKPVEIYQDYRIYSVDIGIMGERNLSLSRGSPSLPPVPAGDTLRGLFVIGPSEAIGMMHLLEGKVSQLADISAMLLHGKDNTPSMVYVINTIARFLDSASIELLGLSRVLDETASVQIAKLEELTGKTAAFSGKVSRAAPGAFETFERSLTSLAGAVEKLESGIGQLIPLLAYLDGPEMEQWQSRMVTLQEKLAVLHELLADLSRRGLNLKIRLFN